MDLQNKNDDLLCAYRISRMSICVDEKEPASNKGNDEISISV